MKTLNATITGSDGYAVDLEIEISYSKNKVHLVLKSTGICGCQGTVSLDVDSARDLYNAIAEAQAYARAKNVFVPNN